MKRIKVARISNRRPNLNTVFQGTRGNQSLAVTGDLSASWVFTAHQGIARLTARPSGLLIRNTDW
jgi:hypothetical protein